MFIFRRPALAVLAALVAAWLLPHLIAETLNEPTEVTQSAVATESTPSRLAKGP